jgi:hypothetical protein
MRILHPTIYRMRFVSVLLPILLLSPCDIASALEVSALDNTVIVALLGLVGTLLGASGFCWKSRKEVQAIRQALISEIASISGMIRLRGYVDDLRDTAAELDSGVHGPGARLGIEVPLDLSSYRPNWTAYSNRIGSLRRQESDRIYRFYQLVDGVARDVCPGGVLHAATSESKDFRDAADILELALEIADVICGVKSRS